MPMYSVEDIKEILSAFDKSKATMLEIKSADGEKLTVEQKKDEPVVVASAVQPQATVAPIQQTVVETVSASPFVQTETANNSDDGSKPVNAPMVGVFYSASAPDKEPYVSVGSKVKKGDILCLIEAMKLMNEVTAEQSGEIVNICVENGQVVEFGQPLFMIK